MEITGTHPWMVSLHGGHSSDFCEHAKAPLRDLIETAIKKGMTIYGMAEHAPRIEEQLIYPEERALGWTVQNLTDNFKAYAKASLMFQKEYADRIMLLRGFEAEVVPQDRYVSLTRECKERYDFDYVVGSVHYVGDRIIDYTPVEFQEALEASESLDTLAVQYYETVAEMALALRPDVIGHFDVIRKFGSAHGRMDSPAIRSAAARALEAIRQVNAILDINTGGFRWKFDSPFPAGWILETAHSIGIPCCFGDDSHTVEQVGDGIVRARQFLLSHGITEITALVRSDKGELERRIIPLN